MFVRCPCFTAVQQCATDTCLIHIDFGLDSQVFVLPSFLREFAEGGGCRANPAGNFIIQREIYHNCGAHVCERQYTFKLLVIKQDLASGLQWKDTSPWQSLKATSSSTAEYIPNRVGARTHPCLTPFLMGKVLECEPLYWMVACISSWKAWVSFRIGGQPITSSTQYSPDELTVSKAFVRSTKAMRSGLCCSWHFSCTCFKANMSTVDLLAQKPHWLSGKNSLRKDL